MQKVLRTALVTQAICKLDMSGVRYMENPYGSQPTAAVTALASAGAYSVSAWTTTEDNLTVTDEVAYGEHVYGFEQKMSNFNLMATRMEEMAHAVRRGIDRFVLNNLCEDATGTYTTPAGGFTTQANWATILSNLLSKVAGYTDGYTDTFLVLENTDLPGVIASQMASGFNFADAALRNGLISNQAGVDIYVVRSGTYANETLGSTTYTNLDHRVFGVKGAASVVIPGYEYDEKGVSGKTGKEIAVSAQVGFKLWAQNTGLCVDVTIA